MTRATRPMPVCPPSWTAAFSTVAVMLLLAPARGQRVSATDDLADFLGDICLPGRVGQPGVGLDEFFRVVGRRLARATPSSQLGRRALEQRVIDPRLDVARQQRVEHTL